MADDDENKKEEEVKTLRERLSAAKGPINSGSKVVTDIINGESFVKIVENFATDMGWGGVVGLFNAITGLDKGTAKEDPMRKEVDQLVEDMKEVKRTLKELNGKVEQLSGLVTDGFNDMKAFITEQAFYLQVAVSVGRLSGFLQDVFNDPSDDNTRDFVEECGKGSPRGHAYTILDLLKNDATNPLRMAMANDKLKSKQTFGKWKSIIKEVLGHLLVLDYVYEGMREKTSLYAPDDFSNRLVELDAVFDAWQLEYKNSYWPGVIKSFAEDTMKANESKSKEEVAELVKDGLNSLMTSDSFYFFTSNKPDDCTGGWGMTFTEHGMEYDLEHYLVAKTDSRAMLIFRSPTGNDKTQEDVENLKPLFADKSKFQQRDVDLTKLMCEAFTTEKVLSWANSKFENGPGWWVNVEDKQHFQWTWVMGFL